MEIQFLLSLFFNIFIHNNYKLFVNVKRCNNDIIHDNVYYINWNQSQILAPIYIKNFIHILFVSIDYNTTRHEAYKS